MPEELPEEEREETEEERAERERQEDEKTRRVVPNRREKRARRGWYADKWWQRRSPKAAPIGITAHLPRRDVFVRAMVRQAKRENSDQPSSE